MAHDMSVSSVDGQLKASCSCGKRWWKRTDYDYAVEQYAGAKFLAVLAPTGRAYINGKASQDADLRAGAQLKRVGVVPRSMDIKHAAGVAAYLRHLHSAELTAAAAMPAVAGQTVVLNKSEQKPPPTPHKVRRELRSKIIRGKERSPSYPARKKARLKKRWNGTGVIPASVQALPAYPAEPPPW